MQFSNHLNLKIPWIDMIILMINLKMTKTVIKYSKDKITHKDTKEFDYEMQAFFKRKGRLHTHMEKAFSMTNVVNICKIR